MKKIVLLWIDVYLIYICHLARPPLQLRGIKFRAFYQRAILHNNIVKRIPCGQYSGTTMTENPRYDGPRRSLTVLA